ncbi:MULTISPECIES: FadD3 family acyl-CoA ligase [Streptomyces]|uniref:FadD3 family acyl-CoA ligase n=2 Tax=Streptomyces TaxID=1883 RepID=A0ABW1DYW7_9ACTN|nr:FadD3 family acyl-CoA ligase [Streptomyces hirsutus]
MRSGEPVAAPNTIPAVLDAAARTHGDKPAYVSGSNVVTFNELRQRVRAAARRFATLGVDPGDRVAVWAPNSVAWVMAALGVHYCGATLVPVNSRYTGREAADIVTRTRAKVVVLDDGFLGRGQAAELRAAGATGAAVVTLRPSGTEQFFDAVEPTVSEDEVVVRASKVSPDDVADILFTSGTTGKPKGALSAHRQTVGVARAWSGLTGVTADDRYLAISPFFHSFGYKVGIVTGLVTGATLYPPATFDPDDTLRLIQDAKITVLPGAPTIYQSLLTAPSRPQYDVSSLRLAVTGAAVVPVVLIEQMRDALGIDRIVSAFGMTEAVVVTMCREGDSAETVANTSGRAVPGMEIGLGDGGELLVRGDYVMLGYLDDPEATAQAIDADGWLHTGDVATVDADGNLKIVDRLKDMYISGGFNVYPAEVEQTLMRLDGVSDVAVVGVPDERMGEVGKAYVVGTVAADEVIAFARAQLANFKVPRLVEVVDGLPRNPSGKVLKKELGKQ